MATAWHEGGEAEHYSTPPVALSRALGCQHVDAAILWQGTF